MFTVYERKDFTDGSSMKKSLKIIQFGSGTIFLVIWWKVYTSYSEKDAYLCMNLF